MSRSDPLSQTVQNTLQSFLTSLGVTLSSDALLVLISFLFFCLGFWVAYVSLKMKLRKQAKEFKIRLDTERQVSDDQIDQLGHTFQSLSHTALEQNNSAFLTLAKENFEQLKASTVSDLNAREQRFANLVQPITDTIKTTEEQLKNFATKTQVNDALLREQISNLLQTHQILQSETRNLSHALRRPEVRGQWGELTLRRLVELAGLSEHCDFTEQANVKTEKGSVRPDMLIQLPNKRQLIVDVKTPIDAFIGATESHSKETQREQLKQHAQNFKKRIQELAGKQYWQQFAQAPDFIIMFVPGDQFLSSALQHDPSLLEYALEKRVLLATPTSLVGLLRAIAYGWNQDAIAKNTHELKSLGETLYRRLHRLTDHLNKLGSHLDQSVLQFNRLIGSFQRNTLPAAKRLSELGVTDQAHNELTVDSIANEKTHQLNQTEQAENTSTITSNNHD